MKRKAFWEACLMLWKDSHPDEIVASIFLLLILFGGIIGTVITRNPLLGFYSAGVFVILFFSLCFFIKAISQLLTTLKEYYKQELEVPEKPEIK